ncbi:uncharacterized protein ACB057_009240 [Neosynchiropus ocellatus]
MRDRLSHMQEMSSSYVEQMEYAESTTSDTLSNVDLEEELPHEAVVFDNSPALAEIFTQSQDIHKDVQRIRLEVKGLREQNSRMLQGTSSMSVIKRDSNAIGADIKSRAEGVLAHLREMDESAHKLEEIHGPNSAVTRIARTQYACLSNGFRDAMFDYNDAEMSHRENCKAQIQRQMEIVGRDVTGEEVEDMIESGQWNVFSDNFVAESKTARSALTQIEKRHQELLDLENRIKGVHEIFLDIALLVEEQGPMLNAIQTNVQKTDAGIQEALVKLSRAKRHDRNNPFKKMFCSCFPCFKKMRDVLEKLQAINEGPESSSEHDDDDDDDGFECREAVLFEDPAEMSRILKEAQSIRKEICQLNLKIEQLNLQNQRFGTSVRRFSLLKKDSDTLARGIQQHGKAVHARLQALAAERERLAGSEGPNSAVSRIAGVQYDTLARAFRAAMSDYSLAEETQRTSCRERIQRQASIMGADITGQTLDEMVDRGGAGWGELFQSLQMQGGRSSRWAVHEIQGRHKELVALEARLKEMQELFLQMAVLVEEQGPVLNSIEANVTRTLEHVEKTNVHMKRAVQYKRKNPFQHFCPCLPCWRHT